MNKIKAMRTPEKGFTLIEILVVIVIIGLLVGFTVVSVRSYLESAKNTQIKSLMGQTISSIERYRMGGGATPTSSQQVLNSLVKIREVYGSLLVNPSNVSVGYSSGHYYVKAPLISNGALGSFWCMMDTASYEGSCPF
jgi:prepilin-type N-terminal cleavage/methylation domain-containing protein